jgi:hypothetical protein
LWLLFISLPFAASSGLKAIQFGQTTSAETLFSSTSPVSPISTEIHSIHPNDGKVSGQLVEIVDDIVEKLSDLDIEDRTTAEAHFNLADVYHGHKGKYWSNYVPVDVISDKTVVRPLGLERRAKERGILQMNCMEAPDVCRNAGWFQNCLMGAKGDHTKVVYYNGPLGQKNAAKNRYNSGVTVNWGRACRVWPFAQLFWHPQWDPNATPKQKSQGFQVDEWPMANFILPEFTPNSGSTETSLRCMWGDQNTAGSNQVMDFRRNSATSKYPTGGDRAEFRWGDQKPLVIGDSFLVQFNFSRFDPSNTDHNNLLS